MTCGCHFIEIDVRSASCVGGCWRSKARPYDWSRPVRGQGEMPAKNGSIAMGDKKCVGQVGRSGLPLGLRSFLDYRPKCFLDFSSLCFWEYRIPRGVRSRPRTARRRREISPSSGAARLLSFPGIAFQADSRGHKEGCRLGVGARGDATAEPVMGFRRAGYRIYGGVSNVARSELQRVRRLCG